MWRLDGSIHHDPTSASSWLWFCSHQRQSGEWSVTCTWTCQSLVTTTQNWEVSLVYDSSKSFKLNLFRILHQNHSKVHPSGAWFPVWLMQTVDHFFNFMDILNYLFLCHWWYPWHFPLLCWSNCNWFWTDGIFFIKICQNLLLVMTALIFRTIENYSHFIFFSFDSKVICIKCQNQHQTW